MKNIFISLISSYLMSILAGFISLLFIILIFSDYYNSESDILLEIFLRTFVNLFIAFIFHLAILLPIALIDKKAIAASSFEDLIRRYLPIICIPLGIAFLTTRFVAEADSTYCFFTTSILNVFCISSVALWSFINKLK